MIQGKGIYIWQLRRCDGGDMGKVVSRLKEAGMTHVLPKIADGVYTDTNGNWAYLPALVDMCHKAGIQVIGWQYVYGANPTGEADRAITELRKQPFDGFVINAESQYRDLANNAQVAKVYCQKLRAVFPDLLLGLSTYRFPHYHPRFPFNAFLEYCDVNMPQVYWMGSNGTVPRQLADTITAYRPYLQKPMIPTGAAFAEHGWTAIPSDQLVFVNEVKKHGLSGCNWWEYWEAYHRTPELGAAITAAQFGGVTLPPIEPDPPENPPLTKLYYPCDPKRRISQYFGERPNVYTTSRGHNGVDWAIPVGNPIYAAWDGVVEVAREDKTGYGRHVRIKHSHGLTIYGHMYRVDVQVGDRVSAKQVIGLSGGAVDDPYAGMSTGPHLHFEYRLDVPVEQPGPGNYVYNAIDPLPLLVEHEEVEVLYQVKVITGALNVRTGPGVSYPTAGPPMPKGTVVNVYEERAGWLRIGTGRWCSGHSMYVERITPPEPPAMTLEERVERLEKAVFK